MIQVLFCLTCCYLSGVEKMREANGDHIIHLAFVWAQVIFHAHIQHACMPSSVGGRDVCLTEYYTHMYVL